MRSAAAGLAVCLSVGTAHAHIRLLEPAPRHDLQKQGPCGAGPGDVRGDAISTFPPGATITVRWQEIVPHPGYFRISFDPDGQDDFLDPPAPGEPVGDSVLVDAIADRDGTEVYAQEVTLPDIECDRCTLQVVQVMTDKPPYGDGNDLYYQCVDLVLAADEPATGPPPAEPIDEDAGCGCRSSSPGAAWLALALLAAIRRRRLAQNRSDRPT